MANVNNYRSFLDADGHYAVNKWSHYPEIYDEVFAAYRESCKAALEIGVQNGGSLQMLMQMFPNAKIHGIDINPACASLNGKLGERITVEIGDATDTRFLATLPTFDVIIDDGSHIPQVQAVTFSFLFQHKLSANGVYVVEDLEHSYYDWWRTEPWYALGSFYDFVQDRIGDMNSSYVNRERAANNYFALHLRKLEVYQGLVVFHKASQIPVPENRWWHGPRIV
jgi:hypothetical protein